MKSPSRPTAIVTIALLLAGLTLLAGCAGKAPDQPAAYPVEIKAIAVLPVEIAADEGHQPPPGIKRRLEEGRETMDRLVGEYFSDRAAVTLLGEGEISAIPERYAGNPAARARAIGQQVGRDAVLLVTLRDYRQREGRTYSVSTPASVAFDYQLIRTDNGEVLCTGLFEETQQPLLSNIFNFFTASGRGFRWITAEELAEEGIRNKFGSCPYLR